MPLMLLAIFLTYNYVKNRAGLASNVVRVSGNIEVTQVEMSFRMSGWVSTRPASEGQFIKVGQLVAEMDAKELVQEVALRRAEVQAAQAALAEMEAGSRPEEIKASESTVEALNVDSVYLRSDYERMQQLHNTGVATTQEFDSTKARYDSSMAKLHEAQERMQLVKQGPRKEEIEQARARLEQARQMQALAETHLDYATLDCPIDGLVLSENVEAGEYVVSGTPIVTVGEMGRPWLRAYINETDMGRVKTGQKVKVTTDTYKNNVYYGVVSFISSQAEFTPKSVQTQKERVKLVYRVKIDIANPKFELKPGMPADAEILLGQ